MVGADHLSFVRVRPNADVDSVIRLLTGEAAQQTILSRTTKENGALIVTKGTLAADALRAALAVCGETLVLPPPEPKKFNPWAWRGILSVVGQSGQLLSGYFTIKHRRLVSKSPEELSASTADAAAIVGFATLNLMANFINILFGAQKKNDPHQLRFLKDSFNKKITGEVREGEALPSVDRHISESRADYKQPNALQNFLRKYSVSFGEIGLRTIGSFSLAFPVTQYGKALKALRTQGAVAAFKAAKNNNPATYVYGLLMLTGKLVSFVSKEPDPYNPKPPSSLDVFREKYTFKLSSWIEGIGAAWSAQDRLLKQKIHIGGKAMPDIFGGGGNVVFVGGYVIRLGAPYGSLEVDMPELYAHISDGLAKLPPDKIQARLAETSEWLADHFKEKKIEVSKIYEGIAHELTKHHRIRLAAPEVANQPSSSAAPMVSPPAAQVTHADRQGCMVSGAEPLKQAGM